MSRENRGFVRPIVYGVTALITVAGIAGYASVVAQGDGLNVLEICGIALFGLLFGWIAFSFTVATLGWWYLGKRTSSFASSSTAENLSPTAILMPVYNESPERVFAGITAMLKSLDAAGDSSTFDFYVLSDTTDHEIWLQEEKAWSTLTSTFTTARVFYRHRRENKSRKAGNIAEFCERWGGRYAYMIVLDADSLVEGATMIELVRRMDADDQLGILQVPPAPIGRHSLFARLQQFAAAAYGRIFVEGFAVWAGSDGNYWGHNAIIRIEPFLQNCDLPKLPGKAPLGGEILSHDFVEAALMRRAGWKVELATDLGGSYEECPTTLADYAKRDQRWCQGNLQHARLVVSENFHPLSRFHFSSGVMAYVASPLWILFMLTSIGGAFVDHTRVNAAPPDQGVVEPASFRDAFGSVTGATILFIISMSLLLLPKVFALTSISADSSLRRSFGGSIRLWASGLIEISFSILMSPIMALFHSRFVLSTLSGFNVKWNAQQRDEQGVSWREAASQFASFTLLGCIGLLIGWWLAPAWLIWFSPLLVGLIFSIPIAVAMGSGWLGKCFRRFGFLLIPEEISPPAIAMWQMDAIHRAATEALIERPTMFESVIRDPVFHTLHTHIQLSTGGHAELSLHQSKAIEAAFAAGGAERIPVEIRNALLADLTTLKALHLQSQT